jgi:hypothetical protein
MLRKSKLLSARRGAEKTRPSVVSVAWVEAEREFGFGRIAFGGMVIWRWAVKATGARHSARRVVDMRIVNVSIDRWSRSNDSGLCEVVLDEAAEIGQHFSGLLSKERFVF